MQHVFIEKPYKFLPPFKAKWPIKLIMLTGIYKRWLRKLEGVESAEVRNHEKLQASIAAGHSVLITPNHSRTADPLVMGHLAVKARCTYYAMASWHTFNQGWLQRMLVRTMGAFSVNREGVDRTAVETAISLLANGDRPSLLFPEGTTSRTNDKLMPLLDGPAFIARSAAKKRAKRDGGKVVVHPVAIKYVFQGDIQTACDETLGDIEERLSWCRQSDLPIIERIQKLGNALLTLKELQFNAPAIPGGSLVERQQQLVNLLLHPLEREWLGKEASGGIQIRIKNLRMQIFPEIAKGEVDVTERNRRWKHLEQTYLAQQIDGYPKNYVEEFPSVTRVMETIERFEEDLTDKARIHGKLKAIIDVLDPIEVSTKRTRGVAEDPLMTQIRESLQNRLDELKVESDMYPQ